MKTRMKLLIGLIGLLTFSVQAQVALKFDGSTVSTSSDRVSTSYVGLADSSARTVEMWIKRGTISTAQGIMSEWGVHSGNGSRFTVKVQNNHLRFESGGATFFLEGTTSLSSTSTWYHVAVVVDPTLIADRVKLYLNGNLEASGYVFINTDVNISNPITIGTRFNGVGAFNGAIDEFRIWNTARTQAEIQASMNAELCQLPASLAHYFKFNEGTPGANNTAITNVVDEVNPLATNSLQNFTMTGTLSNFATGTISTSTDITIFPASSCTSYVWAENGQTYNSTGQYDVMYTNGEGCDSIVRLDLTVTTIDNSVTDNMDGTITANMIGATYQWLDCNNSYTTVPSSTAQIFIAPGSGSYAVEVTNNGCKDTSVCVAISSAPTFINTAISFDGLGDYISTDFAGVLGNNAITSEAWIKTNGVNNEQVITAWGSDAVNGGRFTFRLANVSGNFVTRIEIKGGGLNGTVNVNDGSWHHVAVTYDPALATNKYKLYVDGILDTEGDIAQSLNILANTDMYIGRRLNPGFTGYFNGNIDEVRVWNTARTQAEIAAEMDNGICEYSENLLAYYPFNEGTPNDDNTGITSVINYGDFTANNTFNDFALTGSISNYVIGSSIAPGYNFGAASTVSECETYTWPVNSIEYTASGIYTEALTNANGCDSLLVLNLTINQPTSSLQVVSECSAYTWPVNNTEYTATGIYTVVIPNTANCDSTITLDLTISQPTSSTQTVTTCGSYLWGANNTEYNTTGVYSTTIPNAANCDSVITLNLTVNQSTTATVSETACGNYLWAINGQNYDESGVYIAVIPNAANCDSTITLNLTITEIPVTITANGGMFSTNLSGVTYQWINCDDNTEVDGATGQIFTPTVNGNYALVVDNGSCTDTSNCLMINNVGIESIKSNNARVYPNPVESELNVHFVEVESGTIKVLDLHGKLVSEYQFDGKETMMIDLSNDAPGVYLIHLNTTNNTSVTRIMKK